MDFAGLWDAASAERKKQLLTQMFEAVRIRDGVPVAVQPKAGIAHVFAVKLQTGGPDRG